MTQRLTRRDAGLRLLAQSALLSGFPLPLLAQDEQDAELRSAIATAVARGWNLRSTIIVGPIPVNSWSGQVLENDLAHRDELARAFEEASPSDVRPYVYDGFMPVHDFMVRADVRPVPTAGEVAESPIDISCRDVPDGDDSTSKVVVDILVDTLDLAVEGELFQEFLRQDPDLRAVFERLVQKVTTRNWSTVADLLDVLLWGLTVGGGAVRFAEFLTAREVSVSGFFGRLAWKLALRFANILGWAYLTSSLLLAIKANAHRFSGTAADSGCS